jgi:hypothetical protein
MWPLSLFRRSGAGRRSARVRLAVEQLEERAVPAAFTVTNLNDAGGGSLRQAVLNANATAGADTITFQPGLTGPITLTTGELPVTASVTITGPGAGVLTVSGNNASRIFEVDNGADGAIVVTISGLTLTQGKATDPLQDFEQGGAIRVGDEVLALRGVVITGNTAGSGGGLFMAGPGQLTLANSTVSGNTVFASTGSATGSGGGLILGVNSVTLVRNSVIAGNQAPTGSGGVFVGDGGSLTVENSTLSGNQATAGFGGGIVAQGSVVVRNSTISGNSAKFAGGIGVAQSGSLTVENSTISGNAARADGGGIYTEGGAVTLRNSTVAFNTADSDNLGGGNGGGLFVSGPASVALQSTIVADNAVGATGSGPDISGPVTATFSLVENTAGTVFAPGSVANLLGLDPRLGPLADNGGPTKTHALLAGSPAIDHGSNPAGLAFDQRGAGFPRAAGAGVDIGAFELQPNPPPAPPPQIVAVTFLQKRVARVRVRDAASGALRGVLTPFRGFGGRLRLQLQDVNGDGSLDLIVRALIHGKRKEKLFDAVTLAPLPPGLA